MDEGRFAKVLIFESVTHVLTCVRRSGITEGFWKASGSLKLLEDQIKAQPISIFWGLEGKEHFMEISTVYLFRMNREGLMH